MSSAAEKRHVGVIGAGPIGLYAALRLVKEGHSVTVWESGEVAANVLSWGFVELFSSVGLNVPKPMREALSGEELPDDAAYLTGGAFRDTFLLPLAQTLRESGKCEIKENCRVVGVGRGRLLKGEGIAAIGDSRRLTQPFRVLYAFDDDDDERVDSCDALVDASGTYSTSSALRSGVGGLLAPGERQAENAGKIVRVVPDPATFPELVAGKRVAVLGAGYSAVTTLQSLLAADCSVLWLVRKTVTENVYERLPDDPLPQRDRLASLGNDLVRRFTSHFEFCDGVGIQRFEQPHGKLRLHLERDNGETLVRDVDLLFSLTGYRPDAQFHSELQVHTCYASDGPMNLAATLLAAKGAGGDCLAQAAPGPATLQNPEPGFFILGMKSYGRNSSFLMRVGYEQVDLLLDAL